MIDFKQYTEMCDVLTQWAKEYAAGTPSVPDDVYDKNYIMLKEFEAANPDFILDTSPTRHVEDGAEGFRKVRHEIPMISISNSNGIEEATEWCTATMTKAPTLELEYKIDGLGLALKYKDGQLIDSITRGKDNVGDSVYENALRVRRIPHKIDLMGDVEIRGEVVWKFADFEPINDQLEADGKKTFANPRNGAAGTLKMHDPEEVGRRGLSFIGYLIVKGSPNMTQTQDIDTLESLGFEVPEHHTVNSIQDFVNIAESMRERRFAQAYPIDGVVIKVDSKELQSTFGYTAKSPNFYRAYKFPPEEKETLLLNIEESIGMSGAITPVAVIEPVNLAMTTVTRCSLHNWDLVDYLGLHKGCHVVIRKAGEIIPELVKCVETGRTKDEYEVLRTKADREHVAHVMPWNPTTDAERHYARYTRPSHCPYCGSVLKCQVNESGKELVGWVCDNPDCRAQLTGKLSNFVSRECMNIMGVGESIVDQLVESGMVTCFADLYTLNAESVASWCGKTEKGAQKIIDAIQKSKGNYLHQLIEGLSIPGIGHQVSPAIAKCVSDAGGFAKFVSSNPEESAEFIRDFAINASSSGVSDLLANKFVEYITNNVVQIARFVQMGIAQTVKEVQSAKLAGKVCIMTGTFEKLDRDVFKDMVVANGGTVCSSITKKCNVVLMGDNAGPSKVQKIKDLTAAGQHIDVYTPETLDQFLDLLK